MKNSKKKLITISILTTLSGVAIYAVNRFISANFRNEKSSADRRKPILPLAVWKSFLYKKGNRQTVAADP